MRQVSRRFLARLTDPVEWRTEVWWSNDGGQSWDEAELVSGSVKASALSQMRWSSDLTLDGVSLGLSGINPYSTRFRIMHGMAGEPLLPMGVHRVTDASVGREGGVKVTGRSFESYLIAARFRRLRAYPRGAADLLVSTLIREIIPDAELLWPADRSVMLPRLSEESDRWGLIDGRTDSPSIARSLGVRIFCDGAGVFVVEPVPALTDPAVFEAREGNRGVLVDHAEELSSDGVYNIVVATGEPETDEAGNVTFLPRGEVADQDEYSPTYVGKPVSEGGFGQSVRFYESQFIRTNDQALNAAQGLLAPSLGLKQKVTFSTLPQPHLEPGDVGIVHTKRGPRRVILDEVTYDLLGGPMGTQTRTTATRLEGSAVAQAAGEGGE